MSTEPTPQRPTTGATAEYPETPADAYGQPISAQRQTELQSYLDRWATETDHGERKGPFDRSGRSDEEKMHLSLTGADVSWLAKQSGSDEYGRAPHLHLEGADLDGAHLEHAALREVHLEYAHLDQAHLEGALLFDTLLEGATLREAHLERAAFNGAQLEGVTLRGAHLEGAYLSQAHLERADLREVHLEGADLSDAHLEGADLRSSWMDRATRVNDATLDRASLDQLSFDGTNLAVIPWQAVGMLGDEVRARATRDERGIGKDRQIRLNDYEAAVRAHLQLAAVLRSQGMSEQADRFAYQAQKLQRTRYRRQRHLGQWLFSWLLFLLAGYGYRPGRSLVAYLGTIAAFALGYALATQGVLTFGLAPSQVHPLAWYEAVVLSFSAFHGRGFFNPPGNLGDPVAILATAEAVIGLFIEISFIATFTQRYFGVK
jgi:uncharacterized protein YjbI with pentapeptide repeats